MTFLLCIDDTDTIDSIGTGTICEMIKASLIENNLAKCTPITRHQLLIHEDIPYTSHNSSMCFTGELLTKDKAAVIKKAKEILIKESAVGSDPGLCVAFYDDIKSKETLIEFGINATQIVLSKDLAYNLAGNTNLHLTEHGGTGDGIIGAIAGVGLRLSGNNGEAKGVLKKISDEQFTVSELLMKDGIDCVATMDGEIIPDDATIYIKKQTKVVFRKHQFTLLVFPVENGYEAYVKKEIRKLQMGDLVNTITKACHHYKADVLEEQITSQDKTCLNCTYRRWTSSGITCCHI